MTKNDLVSRRRHAVATLLNCMHVILKCPTVGKTACHIRHVWDEKNIGCTRSQVAQVIITGLSNNMQSIYVADSEKPDDAIRYYGRPVSLIQPQHETISLIFYAFYLIYFIFVLPPPYL